MKTIQLPSGHALRVRQLQIAGEIVDAAGNQIDSGNTLVTLTPDENTAMPAAEIAAAIEPPAPEAE